MTTFTVVDSDPAVHDDPAAIVAAARDEAARLVLEAKREAFEIYRSANSDAEEVVENARVEAAQIVQTARADQAAVAAPEPISDAPPQPEALPQREVPISPYDVVDHPEPQGPSPFDEPERVSRYEKNAGRIPRLGDEAGRDAVNTATALRDMLRR